MRPCIAFALRRRLATSARCCNERFVSHNPSPINTTPKTANIYKELSIEDKPRSDKRVEKRQEVAENALLFEKFAKILNDEPHFTWQKRRWRRGHKPVEKPEKFDEDAALYDIYSDLVSDHPDKAAPLPLEVLRRFLDHLIRFQDPLVETSDPTPTSETQRSIDSGSLSDHLLVRQGKPVEKPSRLQMELNSIATLDIHALMDKIQVRLSRLLEDYDNDVIMYEQKSMKHPVDFDVPVIGLQEWKVFMTMYLASRQRSSDVIVEIPKIIRTVGVGHGSSLNLVRVSVLTPLDFPSQALNSHLVKDVISLAYRLLSPHDIFINKHRSSYPPRIKHLWDDSCQLTETLTKALLQECERQIRRRSKSTIDVQKIYHSHIENLTALSGAMKREGWKYMEKALKSIKEFEQQKILTSEEDEKSNGTNLDSSSLKLPIPAASTYARLIHLLMERNAKVAAWDMYAHSRLVAYPVPTIEIYNVMLNACLTAYVPAPERATEIYEDLIQNDVKPTAETYSLMIYVLCRSRNRFRINEIKNKHEQSSKVLSSKERSTETSIHKGQYLRALELFREMINEGFMPTSQTLEGLLVGAQTQKDLGRARWIWSRYTLIKQRQQEQEQEELRSQHPGKEAYGYSTSIANVKETANLFSDLIRVYGSYFPEVFHSAYENFSSWDNDVTGPLPANPRQLLVEVEELLRNYLPEHMVDEYVEMHRKAKVKEEAVPLRKRKKISVASPIETERTSYNESEDSTAVEIDNFRDSHLKAIRESNSNGDDRLSIYLSNPNRVTVQPNRKLLGALLELYMRYCPFQTFLEVYTNIFRIFDHRKQPFHRQKALVAATKVPYSDTPEVIKFAEDEFNAWDSKQRKNTYSADLISSMFSSMINLYSRCGQFQEAIHLLSRFVRDYPLNRQNKAPTKSYTAITYSSPIYTETTSQTPFAKLTFRQVEDLYRGLIENGLYKEAKAVRNISKAYFEQGVNVREALDTLSLTLKNLSIEDEGHVD